MKEVEWNPLKSERLKKTRGVSFEEIIASKLIAIIQHPHRENQKVMVFERKRSDNMRKIKLTREERAVEEKLEEYVAVSKEEFNQIAQAIASRKKDSVLNIRINHNDLQNLKQKATKLGVKYQTFVSEILHKVAQA